MLFRWNAKGNNVRASRELRLIAFPDSTKTSYLGLLVGNLWQLIKIVSVSCEAKWNITG